MVTGFEIVVLLVALAAVLVLATIVRAAKPFILNAIGGLLVLLAVDALLGYSVAVTPVALVIVALGGLPGALAVLALSYFGVAFAV